MDPPTTHHTSTSTNPRVIALEREIASLKAQMYELDPSASPEAIVQQHIRLLHTYNEIKDGTQLLIAKYAVIKGVTVRSVHEELGLPTEDPKR